MGCFIFFQSNGTKYCFHYFHNFIGTNHGHIFNTVDVVHIKTIMDKLFTASTGARYQGSLSSLFCN
jgi:hypothetical protein